MERTLIIFKPDAVQRRLCGRLLSRFEEKGLKLVGCKLMQVSRELAEEHYTEHRERPFFNSVVSFLSSQPVLVLALEGFKAISVCRTMMGATFGYEALPGTIRGDFGISNQYNLIHGSDSPAAAQRELGLYFSEDELLSWDNCDNVWIASE